MPEHTQMALESAFGIQHANDQYWFRPLILGDNLFTYVAHIPPGGGVPPYPEAAKRNQIEHSLYILQGCLKITMGGESVTLVPHTALHFPAGEAIEMINEGDITATIYMAYTPSPWGPGSPYEDRRQVTNLDEMRSWYEERGHRIWSPDEMDAMAGDLSARLGSLNLLDQIYQESQTNAEGGDEKPWISLWDSFGYRHGHTPHPPDDFWFRPLVSGDKHLTYIGQIPVDGGVDPSPEEAEYVEMSIYTLSGDLECVILNPDGTEQRFIVPPHEAVYAPLHVPLGFWNAGDTTASFALTFTPTRPERKTISGFRNWAINKAGWEVISPDYLNNMLGNTLWNLED